MMPTTAELNTISEVRKDHKDSVSASVQEHKEIRRGYAAYHGQKGGVWSAADMAKMEEEGRPVLNINKIKPVVNMILGLEINNPLVMRVFAEQSEHVAMAAALDSLGNHQWYRTNCTDKRAEMFGTGVMAKRAHAVLSMTSETRIPQLDVRVADGLQVHIDPGSVAYNPDDDADHMIVENWFTKDALQAMDPDHARDIEALVRSAEHGEEQQLAFPQELHKKLEWVPDYTADPIMRVSPHTNRIQVLEHFKRKTKTVFRLWDPGTNFYEDFDSAKERREAGAVIFRESPLMSQRLVSQKLQHRNMVRSVLMGGVILSETGDSPYPEEMGFPIATFRAHHFGEMTTSVVDDLIDPARQHNVTWANILHIMQSVAHSGWLIPTQSGLSVEEMKEAGSTTGFVKEYKYPFKPEKVEPSSASIQHFTDLGYTDEQIKEISGATEALRGIAPTNIESGHGVDLLQRQGLAVLAILYHNLQRTERDWYTKILMMTQNFMPIPDEVEIMGRKLAGRLAGLGMDDDLVQTGDQKFLRLGVLDGINTLRALQYQVRVAPGPATRHQREYWAQMALSLASQLPPDFFPPEAIIELSDFPFAEDILQHIANMRELQATQAAMAAGTEIAAAAGQ